MKKRKSRGKRKTSKKTVAFLKNFVATFIKHGRNGTAAIRELRPHLKVRSAEVAASKLLKDPEVHKLLEEEEKKLQDKLDISAERVLREVARIAFLDIRKLFNDDGSIKMPAEWDDETAAAIAGMDVEDLFEGRREDREHVGYVRKFKVHNKPDALRDLMKHLGLFEKDNSQKSDPIREMLAAIDGRSTNLVKR